MRILLFILLAIISDAVGDGLEYHQLYKWSHFIELLPMVFIGIVGFYTGLLKGPWWRFVPVLFVYIFFRFAMFDGIYNMVIGQKILYIGSQSVYDAFFSKAPSSILVWFKFISLLFGAGIAWDNIRYK